MSLEERQLHQQIKTWLKHLPKPEPKTSRKQINSSFTKSEYQLIAKAAKTAKRSPAMQLKLMALTFAKQHRIIEEDFAPLLQNLRRLRSLAEDHANKVGGWHKLSVPQLRELANKIDNWESRLERFLRLQ